MKLTSATNHVVSSDSSVDCLITFWCLRSTGSVGIHIYIYMYLYMYIYIYTATAATQDQTEVKII